MAQEIVSVPLTPGIRQDGDRTMLPAGSLVAASGVRRRKGGIAKANGFVNAGVTASAGTFAGPCDALGYAAGREVAVMAGRAWARRNTGDPWTEVGRSSRARPVKAHWGAFTDATSGVVQSACAAIGDYIATAHYDGTGVQLAIMDPSGIRRATAFFTGRYRPRIFAVDTLFILTMADPATGSIYGATINSTTLVVSSATLIIAGVSASDVYDAVPFNATNWILASRTASTTFQVAFGDTSLSLGAFQTVTIAANDVTACSVIGNPGENIFATWVQAGANVQEIAAFQKDLAATIFGATTYSTSASVTPGVMTRRDATSVWLVYEEVSATPTRYRTCVRAYDTVLGQITAANAFAWHVRIASRPWGGSTSAMSIWLSTDGGTEPWLVQRRYTMATLSMDADVPSSFGMFIEPEFSPDERSNAQQTFHPPEITSRTTTDASGATVQRAYLPALATIRTQNDAATGTAALVLYEWETEAGFDARARQVAEVGGQGIVFGGGVQELPSARINAAGIDTQARGVENGFVFAPAILSAVQTATGADGLTEGALYQFAAVYEYVTPDGLRTRSAPSNIARVTPAAGNLNVELKIATAPTSEREFSSPPNQTVVHIYATTGGGKTFQRITPDSGLTAGIGTSTTGIVTYVHSVADTVVAANEPMYTEQGGVANQPAPAHRFGWVGGGYAWVGGLFNPQIIERSKLSTVNEPAQFTRQNTHRCLLPEATTAGAWMDGTNVVFSMTGIYLVPVTLGAPQRHPSTVGCVDFRSLVEVPDGLVFQSRRGIELLPRGFGQPVLISGPVEDSLRGRRVVSATVTGHDGSSFASSAREGARLLVLFAVDPVRDGTDRGVRLTFDLDAGRWIDVRSALTGSGNFGEVLTTWNGRLVVAGTSATMIRYESPTDWGSVETVPVSVTLADLRPFDVLRRGQLSRVLVLGEIRSDTKITLTAYQDGKYSAALPFSSPTLEAKGTAGDKFVLEWQLPIRQCNALTLKLDIEDSVSASPGEGCVLHAIGIEADGLPGRPRASQERQAA